MRLISLLAVASLFLAGCATVEPSVEPTASEIATQQVETETQTEPGEAPEPEPEPEPESEPKPEPAVTTLELMELINTVPSSDLESLRQHFVLIDEGAQSLEPFPIEYQMGPTAVPEKVELVIDRF